MKKDRRDFIKTTSVLGTTAALGSILFGSEALSQQQTGMAPENITLAELPKLDYPYDALEPYIDAKTLEIHHSKHHNAYVQGLNKALEELAKARFKEDYSIIDYWVKKSSFHGAGHVLHTLYWKSMTPNGGGEPPQKVMEAINKSFGNYKAFKEQFSAAARSVEGSGWALLGKLPNGTLMIYQSEKHENLSPWNAIPILACDVWEHAYYLKYQNKRADYINSWWNVVNWKFVESNF
jgi:Fe-Mn family superoxide dismutase